MSELQSCKTLLDKQYRWIGVAAVVTWLVCIQWLVAWMGVGTYFAIYIIMLLFNAFFTVTNCFEPKNVFWSIVPYLVPVVGAVLYIVATTPASLQLLTTATAAESERANVEGRYALENVWLLAYVETTKSGTPNIEWTYFVGVMVVGFIMYAWSDASDNDAIKGLSALLIVLPIALEMWLGFTYGTSYGIMGSYMGEAFAYLPEFGGYIAALTGSIVEFMLAGIFFSIEHAIMEEEDI